MVVRGWGGSVATAVGVAAAVGAAQLGLGYGLEIISWRPGAAGLTSEAWLASLAWATWIAATSTIAGAVVAERLSARSAPAVDEPEPEPVPTEPIPTGPAASGTTTPAATPAELAPAEADPDRVASVLWRLVLAAAAALGATTTVALTAVPARLAEPADTTSPETVAAGYAVLGVLVGLAIAVGALAARAVTANIILTTGWLWLLAVVAVVDGVLARGEWERVPLAFWMFTDAEPGARWGVTAGGDSWFGNIFLPDAGLAAGAALVIGALAALPAARRGDHPVGVVVSGAAGPLLVAAAYLLAQPELVGAEAVDVSRHLVAPYLVLTGLIGSLLISAVRPRTRRPAPEPLPGGTDGTDGTDGVAGRPGGDGTPGTPDADDTAEAAIPAARGEAELTRKS